VHIGGTSSHPTHGTTPPLDDISLSDPLSNHSSPNPDEPPVNPPPGIPLPQDLPSPESDPNPSSEDEEPDGPNTSTQGIGTGNPDLLDAQELTAHLGDLKDTLAAINEIKGASLDTQFEVDDLAHLRNPTEEELDIND